MWAIIIVLLIVVILTCALIFYNKSAKQSFVGGYADVVDNKLLIDDLWNQGWRLYTKEACHFCHKQLEIISYPHKDVEYMTDKEKQMVQGYPTWYNIDTGQISPGFKDIKQLHQLLKTKDVQEINNTVNDEIYITNLSLDDPMTYYNGIAGNKEFV